MKTVELYTDGACSGNPGPGGYGIVLLYQEYRKELSAGYVLTTNNRMELLAVIRGLEALKEPCLVHLFSDSKYVVDSILKKWVYGWQAKGWVKKNGPVPNTDMWQMLLPLLAYHQVELVWVKGHADNQENNRCDELAREAIANGHLLEDNAYVKLNQ